MPTCLDWRRADALLDGDYRCLAGGAESLITFPLRPSVGAVIRRDGKVQLHVRFQLVNGEGATTMLRRVVTVTREPSTWQAGSTVDTVINKPDRYKRSGMATGAPIRVRFRVPAGMTVRPCPLCWTNNPGSEDSVTFSGLHIDDAANPSCSTDLYPLGLRRSMSLHLMEVATSPDGRALGGYGRARGATWWTLLDYPTSDYSTTLPGTPAFLTWHSSKLNVTSRLFFKRRWFQELALFVREGRRVEPLNDLTHSLEMLPTM